MYYNKVDTMKGCGGSMSIYEYLRMLFILVSLGVSLNRCMSTYDLAPLDRDITPEVSHVVGFANAN